MTEPHAWYGSPCTSCGEPTWETWDRTMNEDKTAGEWVLRRRECVTRCPASKAAAQR